MTKLAVFFLFALSAFGQSDNNHWMNVLATSSQQGEEAAQEIEERTLPAYKKASQELLEAIKTGKLPSEVAKAEKTFSDAELALYEGASQAWLAQKSIPDAAGFALRDGNISKKQLDEAIVLVDKLKKYEIYHWVKDKVIYQKLFEYATSSGRSLLREFDKAVKVRSKTVKDLKRQVGDEAYANRLEQAHQEVSRLAEELTAAWVLLLSSKFEFEEGRLTAKKYEEAKELQAKIREQAERRWLSQEELTLYERASGRPRATLVMR
jgi:predicted transcriptional regulator